MRMPFIGLACYALNMLSLGINFSIICQHGFGGSFDSYTFLGLMTKYRANLFVCQCRIRGTNGIKRIIWKGIPLLNEIN
jgi:hypothetical protein